MQSDLDTVYCQTQPLSIARRSHCLLPDTATATAVCHMMRSMFMKLSPYSTIILQTLTVPHLVKKFPAFYTNRTFITVFTTDRHLSLSYARWMQSRRRSYSHNTCFYVLILSSHQRLSLPGCHFFLQASPAKTSLFAILSTRAKWSAHLILLYLSILPTSVN